MNDIDISFRKINDVLKTKYGVDYMVDNIDAYSLDNGHLLFQTEYIKGDILAYSIGKKEDDETNFKDYFILSLAYTAHFDTWSNSTAIFKKFDSADELVEFLENSSDVYYRLFIRMSDEYKACLDDLQYTLLSRSVTPHGNLIDADALKAEIDKVFDKFANATKDAHISANQ